jgi:hypothetical protein
MFALYELSDSLIGNYSIFTTHERFLQRYGTLINHLDLLEVDDADKCLKFLQVFGLDQQNALLGASTIYLSEFAWRSLEQQITQILQAQQTVLGELFLVNQLLTPLVLI